MRRYLLSLIAVGLWPTLTFAQTSAQVVEYYHTDALGSVRAVTKVVNGQVQVVSRHDFKPFGEEVAPQTPPIDKRLFTGKERDAETGWDYFGARQCAGSRGRFTTVDPLQASATIQNPQSWNRYVYVSNNPLKFVDPNGMKGIVAGDVDDVRKWLREGVGAEAAGNVDVVWNKEEGRWEIAIVGTSVRAFRKLSESANKLADLVTSEKLMVVKATTDEVPREGGPGYAYDIGTRGDNRMPVVLLNKNRYGDWATFWNNSPKGLEHYDPRDPHEIAPMTMGLIIFHEFGHAWGNMNGRRTSRDETRQGALDWENAARRSAYPLYKAIRIIH